jgi:hypothetical protein
MTDILTFKGRSLRSSNYSTPSVSMDRCDRSVVSVRTAGNSWVDRENAFDAGSNHSYSEIMVDYFIGG